MQYKWLWIYQDWICNKILSIQKKINLEICSDIELRTSPLVASNRDFWWICCRKMTVKYQLHGLQFVVFHNHNFIQPQMCFCLRHFLRKILWELTEYTILWFIKVLQQVDIVSHNKQPLVTMTTTVTIYNPLECGFRGDLLWECGSEPRWIQYGYDNALNITWWNITCLLKELIQECYDMEQTMNSCMKDAQDMIFFLYCFRT